MYAQKKSEVNLYFCTDVKWFKSWSFVSHAYVTEGWEMHVWTMSYCLGQSLGKNVEFTAS